LGEAKAALNFKRLYDSAKAPKKPDLVHDCGLFPSLAALAKASTEVSVVWDVDLAFARITANWIP
jgi:hypothetical protein